ncbi:Uncharacterised protein [Streptococcus pneumoniae]|nr:Uncharacterised protein [Streptococcus pneumoniae]
MEWFEDIFEEYKIKTHGFEVVDVRQGDADVV